MRHLMITLIMLALLAGSAPTATAVDSDSRHWNITIKHEDRESNLMGQTTAETGEPCSFMVYFGKGQQGVKIGFDAGANPFEPWQNEVGNDSRRRSKSKEPVSSLPDIMSVFTIVVNPTSDHKLKILMVTNRWELIDEPPPYDYRFETRTQESEIGAGDDWQFLAGTGPDGKEYYLELTIKPTGSGKRTVVTAPKARIWPILFKYRLLTPGTPGQTEFQTVRELALSGSDADDRIEIQVPIAVPGVDSSLLSVDITLDNVIMRNTGARDQLEIDAVFELERWLLIDIKPGPDTTQMNLSQMISSSYNHVIHLRPNKKVRIEIPKIESGKFDLDAREIIEIEPVTDSRTPR